MWLARLEVEKHHHVEGGDARACWMEARKRVDDGSVEELKQVWLWGVNGSNLILGPADREKVYSVNSCFFAPRVTTIRLN